MTRAEQPHVRTFDDADTSRALRHYVSTFSASAGLFDRAIFEPGWCWSEPAGAALCTERHLGYLVSGGMRFRMADGGELEARAGDVYLIPPGHDGWVVGEQVCVALDTTQSANRDPGRRATG
jgi:uncharacterized cupin superfamily protein